MVSPFGVRSAFWRLNFRSTLMPLVVAGLGSTVMGNGALTLGQLSGLPLG